MQFPIRKFLSYYRPHLPLFAAVLSCAFLVSAISLAVPLLVRELTRQAVESGGAEVVGEALRLGGLMLGLVLLQNAGGYFVDYKGHEVGARMERDIRGELFAHMQKLPFDFHDRHKTGELMSRLTHDLLLLSELYHHGPEDYLKYSVRFIGAFAILLTIDVPMTLTVFAFLPILAVMTLFFNKKLNRTLLHNKERIADVNAQAEDSLAGIRVVQAFGREQMETDKFNRANRRFFESRAEAYPLEQPVGRIEFRDISFQYEGREGHVLSGLSLTIEPGEYVALVGPSGSGKTTLCSLIPRFYEVCAGQVLVDGNDVRDLELESLRRAIGTVQQDVYLFDGTIEDNIRYGRPDAAPSEIELAARSAGAHEFIAKLPQGYRTEIGQRGVRLSGGQKQRLCIARVFLQNPQVLILDEATSSLDNESEAAVKQALDRLSAGRTTLVVAHRLSTIREAGRILVLTDDGIAEQGTHDELLARGGVYANLYAKSFA